MIGSDDLDLHEYGQVLQLTAVWAGAPWADLDRGRS
jgi:hypothetical protein